MLKHVFMAAALVAASQSLAADGQAGDASAGARMETVTKVDFRGRPPFKRTQVEVAVADVAALEAPAAGGEMMVVNKVDRRGRPPYRRYRATVPVIDVAALEPAESNKIRRKSNRPPFRRH